MKKVIVKKLTSGEGHVTCTLETPEEVLEKVDRSPTLIMVLPDGRTCNSPDRLLEMIQEDVYKDLPQIEVYQLPILVGG